MFIFLGKGDQKTKVVFSQLPVPLLVSLAIACPESPLVYLPQCSQPFHYNSNIQFSHNIGRIPFIGAVN